jgi:hypothetical protein
MNRNNSLFIGGLIALFVLTPTVRAKGRVSLSGDKRRERQYAAYTDSLNALIQRYRSRSNEEGDTLTNPYYYQLFAPPTLYDDVLHAQMGGTTSASASSEPLSAIATAWRDVYTSAPWLVERTERQLYASPEAPRGMPPEKGDREVPIRLSEKLPQQVPPGAEDNWDDWHIVVHRPNFWTLKTTVSLQLMQNYLSDNWYKGGESSNSWLSQITFDATYNNKQKVIFSNNLDMKLGFLSSHGDEVHKFRTNADQLRMVNKLGLQATSHWYYTVMLQSWTQFYPGYHKNDSYVYSDFMSPFESVFSIGMDYKLKLKKLNVEATLSPIACDWKYVDRKALASSYGIESGKHSDIGLGSNITVKYTWTMAKNISWSGRIYYYTNYEKVQLEWENTFNLAINKYLSTKLYLYPRFDDSVNRKEGDSYLQFNELLSFGLNMSF